MTTPESQSRTFPGRPHDLTSYAGALIVYPVVAMLRTSPHESVLNLTLVAGLLWGFHFTRRIAECLWVHRYADRRVPLADAISEYFYYWGFGAWVAYSTAGRGAFDATLGVGVVVFVIGEAGNAWAHQKLRALRRPNTKDRGIPVGGLFRWVSCANYTYEIIAWSGFCIAVHTIAACVFLVGVIVVLASWARKRHARYLAYFDGSSGRPTYPSERRALVPLVFVVL